MDNPLYEGASLFADCRCDVFSCRCEAGTVLDELDNYLKERGFTVPYDLGPRRRCECESSTLIVTNIEVCRNFGKWQSNVLSSFVLVVLVSEKKQVPKRTACTNVIVMYAHVANDWVLFLLNGVPTPSLKQGWISPSYARGDTSYGGVRVCVRTMTI